MPGYDANLPSIGFSPAKAKQYLAELKYKNAAGLGTIIFSTPYNGAEVDPMATAISSMLQSNLGVTVQIRVSTRARLTTTSARAKAWPCICSAG